MRIGIATSIATAIAIGVLVASQGNTGTANLWVDANGGTCTRSAGLVAYADASACSTFQAAYTAASCGDTVRVKTGTYGGQTMNANSKTSCNTRIKFGAESDSGTYTLTGDLVVQVRAVWIDRATVSTIAAGVDVQNGGDFFELSNSNVVGTGMVIFGVNDALVTGNTFDGVGGQIFNGIQIYDEPAGDVPTGWIISSNTFKNYTTGVPADHTQALYIGYSANGLVEGNTFDNNGETSHIFVTWFGNTADPGVSDPHDICIRGNTFSNQVNTLSADVNFRSELNAATDNISVDPDQTTDNGLDDGSGHLRNC